jgi:hypothetical protein
MSNNVKNRLANLLIGCHGDTTTYLQDAELIIKKLNDEGYTIIKSNTEFNWRDATNISVKGWAIVIYKRYDIDTDTFVYLPKMLYNYNSKDSAIMGGHSRAHLLCEITLPV